MKSNDYVAAASRLIEQSQSVIDDSKRLLQAAAALLEMVGYAPFPGAENLPPRGISYRTLIVPPAKTFDEGSPAFLLSD